MRPRVLVSVLCLILAIPLIAPGSAAAGNRFQPIFGDLNRDGLLDRVTLGPQTGSPTDTPNCTVSVEYRRANGTYRAPVTHSYVSPWPRQPFCPNMGEAINLGKRGQIELVLTNFSIVDEPELLVLRNFQLVAGYTGLSFPSTIRSEDFNGDGREDLWESSDQVLRLRTFTNTPDGTLVPGPIDVCSYDSIPEHVFADFNGDRGQDFLAVIRCGSVISAQVLFGNGQPVVTLASKGPLGTFRVFAGDINRDLIPDAVVTDIDGGTITGTRYFQNNGQGVFTEVTP